MGKDDKKKKNWKKVQKNRFFFFKCEEKGLNRKTQVAFSNQIHIITPNIIGSCSDYWLLRTHVYIEVSDQS